MPIAATYLEANMKLAIEIFDGAGDRALMAIAAFVGSRVRAADEILIFVAVNFVAKSTGPTR
jgi:hypothetical protein